jgi:hypothetical protein
MNVLQVLAVTSVGFVAFAVLWVMVIEDYLEEREVAFYEDGTDDRSEDA